MTKKALSLILCLMLTVCCIPFATASAESTDIEVYSISASPANATVNTLVTYTVTTSTNATKVRVLNPDGTIHTAAYISAGFTNYSDNGGVRTWTLSKRVQVTFNGHKRAIASGEALDDTYTKASKAPYTDQLIVVVHQGDEPDEYIPAEQPVIEREHGLIAGSFLQGWLCRDWTQER